MILFRARHEAKLAKLEAEHARADVAELRDMIRSHFNIKYTLDDFAKWANDHPGEQDIPATVGEFLHFYEMLSPTSKALYYRGKNVTPSSEPFDQEALNEKAEREHRDWISRNEQ